MESCNAFITVLMRHDVEGTTTGNQTVLGKEWGKAGARLEQGWSNVEANMGQG